MGKSHSLTNKLFDNPAAELRTNLNADLGASLQAVYGMASTGHQAVTANQFWQSSATKNPPVDAFFELVFKNPTNLEIFNLRMGGHLPPAKKGQKAELSTPEFEFFLEGAELQFGTELLPQRSGQAASCVSYDRVDEVSGRELLWRSPASQPAQGVRCVKVAIKKPQQTPVIIRSIMAHSGRTLGLSLSNVPRLARPAMPTIAAATQLPTTTTVTTSAVDLRETPREFEARFDRWAEQHFLWVLTVSLAFGSGALAGVL